MCFEVHVGYVDGSEHSRCSFNFDGISVTKFCTDLSETMMA